MNGLIFYFLQLVGKPKKFGFQVGNGGSISMQCIYTAESLPDPKSYKQAMARPDAAEWQKTIDKEMNSLRDMGTLKFVSMQEFWNQKKRNPKLTLLPSSLLLKTKYKDDGAGNSIEGCKIRKLA